MEVLKGRRNHDHAILVVDGKEVLSFGIRRATKEKGHDHLPRDLHLQVKDCKELHQCTLSEKDFLELLREKNVIQGR